MRVLQTPNNEWTKRALTALRNDANFQTLQKYLDESLQALYKRKSESDTQTRWNEGAEMVIEDLLNLIKGQS